MWSTCPLLLSCLPSSTTLQGEAKSITFQSEIEVLLPLVLCHHLGRDARFQETATPCWDKGRHG